MKRISIFKDSYGEELEDTLPAEMGVLKRISQSGGTQTSGGLGVG